MSKKSSRLLSLVSLTSADDDIKTLHKRLEVSKEDIGRVLSILQMYVFYSTCLPLEDAANPYLGTDLLVWNHKWSNYVHQ